ncbi:hypothetical protein AWB69_03306 [Caballeronia udeis]|uniref:Uncharacterized protein n=1 Tax=Caballeronia udeis TaxID=1232866 RepID=A0A158GTJ5_9BURK|nr:hypothetical protein AWB69_03306 [Caballeronia udeis]
MIKIRNFYIVFCLAMLVNSSASAAETEKYQIEFLGGSTIEFAEVESLEGEAIEANLFGFPKSSNERFLLTVTSPKVDRLQR